MAVKGIIRAKITTGGKKAQTVAEQLRAFFRHILDRMAISPRHKRPPKILHTEQPGKYQYSEQARAHQAGYNGVSHRQDAAG